jgi:signal peptidase I
MTLSKRKEDHAMSSRKMMPHYQHGDRVRVDKAVTTVPALPGYVGIVKEVIPSYADQTIGYNLSLDGDPRPERVWFFFQNQLTPA